ncbi:ABC transporter permease [Fibrivirga algicola]|uniref:FtsX-like permease family protein n=1 Tax=Fibrivirga algicola TaxID=2950420 RepID=A0ABX0QFN2_9BACT|nr:ABC transporter permease [Fibrivirga algicola]NID09673.1 FtsX-like permease family protein [Fibrivirga algicola]
MLRENLKMALRQLRTQRTHTGLTIIGLSVGLAGGFLLFLFVEHHLSTDRHHAKFNRTFRVMTDLYLDDGTVEYNAESALPMAQTLRRDYPQVEQAAFLMMNRELTVSVRRRGQTTPLRFQEHTGTGLVEPDWFAILDYTWVQGNPKTALREPNTVVLTESWAKRYFGDQNPIGQTLTLNNKTEATVTGLLAEPPTTTDTNLGLFISLATLKTLDPTYDETSWYYLNSTNRVYATLRDPNAVTSLAASFPALSKKQYGDMSKVFRFSIQPLRDVHFDVARGGDTIRKSLVWSLGAVGLLLIVAACINFVNLATAQALRRSKEVGIRKSLGSSRGQLMGQFLLETALIVLTATALALLIVGTTLPLFNNWTQLSLSIRADWQTVGFIGLLLVGVVLAAGVYPAVVLSGFSPLAVLRGKAIGSSIGRGVTVRQALVITQFVICQALIIGALVVARQVRYVQQADLGFRKDNVVMVRLPDNTTTTLTTFRQQLSRYPAVQSISFNHRSPANDQLFGGSFKFDNRPDWEKFPVRERIADSEYLRTYGLTLVAGRNILASDTIREYLINETLLHQLGFNNPKQVLGKTMQYHLSAVPMPIVGVVKDFHQRSLRESIGPCIIASKADRYAQVSIRIAGQDPAHTLGRIRQTWQQLYPNDVFEYTYLDEQLARFYQTETLVGRLINVFTGIAILICCLGLYGLVSFVVVQRTKEIGVRKVLGASVTSIVALLSSDFLKLVFIALLIASPIAGYVMNGWLQDFAYRVSIGWWVFALAGTLAIAIALLTVSYQSVRAALANPVNSLRAE